MIAWLWTQSFEKSSVFLKVYKLRGVGAIAPKQKTIPLGSKFYHHCSGVQNFSIYYFVSLKQVIFITAKPQLVMFNKSRPGPKDRKKADLAGEIDNVPVNEDSAAPRVSRVQPTDA